MNSQEWRDHVGALLADERVRGDIILISITSEASLDRFLTGYFAYWTKHQEFERSVLTRLSMSQKIDIFRTIEFRPSLKSFPEAVTLFQGINRLRNHAAHVWWGDRDKISKLADNEFVRRFFRSYPHSSTYVKYRIRRLLNALKRSKEYRNADLPDDYDIPF